MEDESLELPNLLKKFGDEYTEGVSLSNSSSTGARGCAERCGRAGRRQGEAGDADGTRLSK